ncbi:MAG: hypothetical protein JWN78_1974 [Bacteroidota bacterium]|nr:hypothetical protein [Bacteroidota bacterium]
MFTIKVLIIGILSFVFTLFLPWYTVAIVAFFTGVFLSNKPGNNFLAGFFGVGLFWLVYTLYLDIFNDQILSTKIALLFSQSLGSAITSPVLIIITTFLGAIIGGLACFSGSLIMDDGSKARLRKAVKNGRYTLKI